MPIRLTRGNYWHELSQVAISDAHRNYLRAAVSSLLTASLPPWLRRIDYDDLVKAAGEAIELEASGSFRFEKLWLGFSPFQDSPDRTSGRLALSPYRLDFGPLPAEAGEPCLTVDGRLFKASDVLAMRDLLRRLFNRYVRGRDEGLSLTVGDEAMMVRVGAAPIFVCRDCHYEGSDLLFFPDGGSPVLPCCPNCKGGHCHEKE